MERGDRLVLLQSMVIFVQLTYVSIRNIMLGNNTYGARESYLLFKSKNLFRSRRTCRQCWTAPGLELWPSLQPCVAVDAITPLQRR